MGTSLDSEQGLFSRPEVQQALFAANSGGVRKNAVAAQDGTGLRQGADAVVGVHVCEVWARW